MKIYILLIINFNNKADTMNLDFKEIEKQTFSCI